MSCYYCAIEAKGVCRVLWSDPDAIGDGSCVGKRLVRCSSPPRLLYLSCVTSAVLVVEGFSDFHDQRDRGARWSIGGRPSLRLGLERIRGVDLEPTVLNS